MPLTIEISADLKLDLCLLGWQVASIHKTLKICTITFGSSTLSPQATTPTSFAVYKPSTRSPAHPNAHARPQHGDVQDSDSVEARDASIDICLFTELGSAASPDVQDDGNAGVKAHDFIVVDAWKKRDWKSKIMIAKAQDIDSIDARDASISRTLSSKLGSATSLDLRDDRVAEFMACDLIILGAWQERSWNGKITITNAQAIDDFDDKLASVHVDLLKLGSTAVPVQKNDAAKFKDFDLITFDELKERRSKGTITTTNAQDIAGIDAKGALVHVGFHRHRSITISNCHYNGIADVQSVDRVVDVLWKGKITITNAQPIDDIDARGASVHVDLLKLGSASRAPLSHAPPAPMPDAPMR